MPGGVCCVLATCCPPGLRRIQALADEIAAEFGWSATTDEERTGNAYAVAQWLLGKYGLVPVGVDVAIVEGYRKAFAELHERRTDDDG